MIRRKEHKTVPVVRCTASDQYSSGYKASGSSPQASFNGRMPLQPTTKRSELEPIFVYRDKLLNTIK